MRRTALLFLIGAAGIGLAACADGAGPGQPGVSLSFSTRSATPTLAPGFSASVAAVDTLVDPSNTLVVTRAQIVLREIDLKRADVTDCVAPGTDGCEEFEAGPVLLDLPLNGGTEQTVAVDVPAGTYNEIEFEIHKISSNDQEDAAFRQAYPDFAGKSIRVEGTFNGEPFLYETDLDVEQEFDLSPALVVTDATATNVTVRIDLSQWFRAPDGTLINPQDGNVGGQYESLIKENIKQSMEAFEDRNGDGDRTDG